MILITFYLDYPVLFCYAENIKRYIGIVLFCIFCFLRLPSLVEAHEVYVLTPYHFTKAMHEPTVNTLLALNNKENLQLTIILFIVVSIVLLGAVIFSLTNKGLAFDRWLRKFNPIGLLIIRLALAASFIYAGYTNAIFGPEVSLSKLPFHQILPFIEYGIGILFLLGLWTEVAAGVALILYIFALRAYGIYLLTYLNYLGEIIVLLLFGSRFFSLDAKLYGKSKHFPKLRQYEDTIIRVFYGVALLYATINIKILHSQVALDVVNQYHLNRYHMFFPGDPLLIVLGAAIVEMTISLFILFGFQTRLVNAVMMFYLTLSLLFFKESVWPHFMLYGLSFSILFNDGGRLSLDALLINLFAHNKNEKKRR